MIRRGRRARWQVSLFLLLCCLPLLPVVSAAGSSSDADRGFVLIVNPATKVTSLTVERVARIFSKKDAHWEDGTSILPVDLPRASEPRARFTRVVYGKSVQAMENYWRKQIFTGRGVPPPEEPGERKVVEFVRSHAGAIGYVSPRTSLGGVKKVSIVN